MLTGRPSRARSRNLAASALVLLALAGTAAGCGRFGETYQRGYVLPDGAMEQIGTAFYGRKAAYDAALEASADTALLEALHRNVYASPSEPPPGAPRLAAYIRETERSLERQDAQALLRCELRFPDP